ncbi:MAG: prepilin-type N-terminal cleavage/methylation domain-containing protein [Candidatus Paceibacterota bacterium]
MSALNQLFNFSLSPVRRRGFTLIEIIIVIVLMFIIAALIVPPFIDFRRSQLLTGETDNVTSLINLARSHTLAAWQDSNYGIHFATDAVTIFPGDNYDPDSPDNITTTLADGVIIDSLDLTGGATEIVFARQTGLPSVYGSTTVALSSDLTKNNVIIISEAGIAYVE